MSTIRRGRTVAAAIVLCTGGLVATTTQPAEAYVNPANCQFSSDLGAGRAAADCYNDSPTSAWYLKLTCERFIGRVYYARSANHYGSGIAVAQCDPHISEIIDVQIVNV